MINISTWDYSVPGFVAITGLDESQNYRFLVFSEEEMCSFPFEVKRRKVEGSKEAPGFRPALRDAAEEKA
jgi:hypothetical protein